MGENEAAVARSEERGCVARGSLRSQRASGGWLWPLPIVRARVSEACSFGNESKNLLKLTARALGSLPLSALSVPPWPECHSVTLLRTWARLLVLRRRSPPLPLLATRVRLRQL